MDVEAVKKEAAKQLEMYLEKLIEQGKVEALVNLLVVEIEKVIPGQIDDIILETLKPKFVPVIVEYVKKEVEKISELA